MAEMMVNLRVLRDLAPVLDEQRTSGIEIRRARFDECDVVCEWVREIINPNWAVACEVALEQQSPSCFIAYQNFSGNLTENLSAENLLGFACYDVVKKGVFGPSGVREDLQESEISTALLLACLHAMAEENSTEAIIGWAGSTGKYSG